MSGFYVIAGMRGCLPNYHSHAGADYQIEQASAYTLDEARESAADLVKTWMDESWDALSEREGAWAEGEKVVADILAAPSEALANGATWDLPRELGNEIIEIVPAEDA